MGSNDHLTLDVEVASWNFTFFSHYSTLPVALWVTNSGNQHQAGGKDVLENKTCAVDKKPQKCFVQQPPKQPESPRAWLEQS